MVKKSKFTVLDCIIGLFLIGAIYFTIGALRIDRLNLNPLFALVCFVLAFGIFSLRAMAGFFLKDPKKNKIAKNVILVVTCIVLIFLGVIFLEINGYFL